MQHLFLYADQPQPGVFRTHLTLTDWSNSRAVFHRRSDTEMLPSMDAVWGFAKTWAEDVVGERGGGAYAIHLNPQ